MNRKEFYNTLSEDVKKKIKACQTEEEMLRVLAEEKIELDPELLEAEEDQPLDLRSANAALIVMQIAAATDSKPARLRPCPA